MALTNTQYDELMRRYSALQLDDVHQQKLRMQEVYEKYPLLQSLDEEIASIGIRCAKETLISGSSHTEEFKKQAEMIRKKRGDILRGAGYPEDYLDMTYHCNDCQDTGYVGQKRCHCFQSAAIDLFYTQSGLKKKLEEENFSHFSFDYYPEDLISNSTGRNARENMHYIVSSCRHALAHFAEDPCNFLFYGETGLGKTFLSHCLAKELLDNAHSVLYYSAPNLFDELADIRFSRNADIQSDDSYIYNCDFLIIDDLGTELTNAFTGSALFTILNERIARGKGTLISTNLSLHDLSQNYSERVFSRISSTFSLYEFFGDDIRLKSKLQHI